MKLLFTSILIFAAFFGNCQKTERETLTEKYIEHFRQIAIDEMQKTGIPASITLAQGLLESGIGQSRLAVHGNNHFGIKCHTGWKGGKMYHDDDAKGECFRTYGSANESYHDHSIFLTGRARYNPCFEYGNTDYTNWAHCLKSAGYATNPQYAFLLIRKIEENQLFIYDHKNWQERLEIIKMNEALVAGNYVEAATDQTNVFVKAEPTVATQKVQPVVKFVEKEKVEEVETIEPLGVNINYFNRRKFVEYDEAVSLQEVVSDFDLPSLKQIAKYNEIDLYSPIPAQRKIFLQPKRNKAPFGYDFHTVKNGESMLYISNLYGMRTKALYKKNRMTLGEEPQIGKILSLRKKVK